MTSMRGRPVTGMDERLAKAAEVLAGHQRITSQRGGPCWCGQWPTEPHDVTWMEHVVAVLAPLLAVEEIDDIEAAEPCDHRVSVGSGMVCIRGRHPFNPNGHVYVSSAGSHVPDRHRDGPEDQ